MVAIVGDIHLNLRKYQQFELNRFLELAALLASKKYSTIVLAGDLFDRARPSLEEIQAMQAFITTLNDSGADVYIIDGNHEAISSRGSLSTFDFLNFVGATYVKHAHVNVEGTEILLTSWSYRGMLKTIQDEEITISHVRAKMPPHLKAEVPFDFIKQCKLVFLGDIHDKYSPYSNVHYTNSPYAIKFNSATPSGSYIELDPKTMNWEYVDTGLPQKVKLTTTAAIVKSIKFNPKYLYQLVIEDTIEELRTLKAIPNVEYVKVVKRVDVEVEELPETIDFLDLLTENVAVNLSLPKETKVKPILKEYE